MAEMWIYYSPSGIIVIRQQVDNYVHYIHFEGNVCYSRYTSYFLLYIFLRVFFYRFFGTLGTCDFFPDDSEDFSTTLSKTQGKYIVTNCDNILFLLYIK
jgi:hypothetical protein